MSHDDQCAVATNAAMEVAMDECSPEDLLTNLGRMVGLEDTPDPGDVPDELDPADCMDMDIVREWIAVRANELIDDGEGMSDAIEQAWAEAGDECGW
jgi:hypothetical protein